MMSGPITESEFAQLMAHFSPWLPDVAQFPLAIAVSGGADSLALAWLVRRWRRNVRAYIVDHTLRRGSDDEACLTQSRLQSMGIPSEILTLRNLAPGPALQSRAREARYQALFDRCRREGHLDLLVGHHEDDQIETYTMRLGKKSSFKGLASIAAIRETSQLRVLRPLLSVPRARLQETLRDQGIDWVEDPSNVDRAYERVRVRQTLTLSMREQARAAIAAFAKRRMLQEKTYARQLASIEIDSLGHVRLLPELCDAELLGNIWSGVAGKVFPPSVQFLHDLVSRPRPVTHSGAMLARVGQAGGGWYLFREPASIDDSQALISGMIWDRRWRISWQQADGCARFDARRYHVAKLGDAACKFRFDRVPSRVLRGLPAIWRGQKLCAVPLLQEFLDQRFHLITCNATRERRVTDGSIWL